MSQETIHELETLIRARYPIIYILSWEESRVEDAVRLTADNLKRKVHTWTVTKGLQPDIAVNKSQGALPPELDVLTAIHFGEEQSLFLLKDYHPFMNDYRVARLLRDLTDRLRSKKQTILLLSPTLKIPNDLEKEIAVLDFGLPSETEIEQKLNDVILSVKDNPQLNLNIMPDKREAIIHAALGLTLDEVENVFARSLVKSRTFEISEILFEKQQIIRKSGTLEYYSADVTMADVGGLDLLKDWLRKRTVSFAGKARDFGLPSPKGVLLLGVQGCGKSLAAKAVSALWNLPLLRIDMGRIFGGIVGSSEENMRKALRVAESVAPCVLWIDELEKGLAGVQSSSFSDSGTTARVFATFLSWMQDRKQPVFIVATANDVSMLPPELMRKGRFDDIFFIDLPNLKERKEIISIHLSKRKRNPESFELTKIARSMEGFSGAEIEQAIISSLYTAFDANRDITTEDIISEAQSAVPLSVTMKETLSELREWAKHRARPASNPEPNDRRKVKKANSL